MLSLGILPFDALLPGWWLAAYLAGLVLVPVLILAVLVLRLRSWHPAQHTPIDPATLPGMLTRQVQPWLGRLGFLGFTVQDYTRSLDEHQRECFIWRLASVKDRTVAIVKAQAATPTAKPKLSLTLLSFLQDGHVIVTADAPLAACLPEHWHAIHRHFTTLEAQLLEHRKRLDGQPVIIVPQQPQLGARLAAEEKAVPDAMLASGRFATVNFDGAAPKMMARPKLAWRQLMALLSGSAYASGRRKDVAAVTKKSENVFEESSTKPPVQERSADETAEEQLERYRYLTTTKPGRKYFAGRIGATIATVVVCLWLGFAAPLETLLVVLGLVLVHELGHWLMMKVFGYQGMGRFFIPFLNPLDRGRKLHAPAWQQLLVILAGPLPGLLAGTAILGAGIFVTLPGWVLDVGGFALLINIFHLLPFLPLDGGRVVDMLIFRDLPFLRPFFTALSGALVIVAWYFTGVRVLLYFAFGMLGGLAWDFRMIRVVRGGRRLGWKDAKDEDETLRQIFKGVREEGNDSFFAELNWHRQIEVLLAEVMRKRPGFLMRIFGGGVYVASVIVAAGVLVACFAIAVAGNGEHVRRMAEATEEFREDFPAGPAAPTEELAMPFRKLEANTAAGSIPDTVALDHFNWPSASRVINAGMVREATFAAWMGALCGKMESALHENRGPEAVRRAEVLLHIRATMEPAHTLGIRKILWKTEQTTLDAIEELAAAGELDEAAISRTEARITALNKVPVPEVENRLLVDGGIWNGITDTTPHDAESILDGSLPAVLDDARFWRRVHERRQAFLNHACLGREEMMCTAAVARHWKLSRKVGELPEDLKGMDPPWSGEGAHIAEFCEAHRMIGLRRLTTIAALRLEKHRRQTGKLPTMWKHALPGGGNLELVPGDEPKLVLEDRESGRKLPKWLADVPQPEPVGHVCRLNPSQTAALSRK
ncbi:hypothetical protein [Luteolibacter sp. Populi]|uniref:hypothetical protein n=1 Tax=Luteolibacter sp. Populi TaxID=3230487 RepID=UPI0034663879